MEVIEVVQKSGKKSLYIGCGSLHHKVFNTEHVYSYMSKRYWYFNGGWEYNGEIGVLTLKGSGNILEHFDVLSNKRQGVRYVHYYPVDITYKDSFVCSKVKIF